MERFGDIYYGGNPDSQKLDSLLKCAESRVLALDDDQRDEFKSGISAFCKRYSYVTQLVRLNDRSLQKLYVFCKYLHALLRSNRPEDYGLGKKIKMTHYRVQKIDETSIELESDPAIKAPTARIGRPRDDVESPLSVVLRAVNEACGKELTETDALAIQIINDMKSDRRVTESAKLNNESTFVSMYNSLFEDVTIKRKKDNDEFFETILSDPDLFEQFKRAILRTVYEECRREE